MFALDGNILRFSNMWCFKKYIYSINISFQNFTLDEMTYDPIFEFWVPGKANVFYCTPVDPVFFRPKQVFLCALSCTGVFLNIVGLLGLIGNSLSIVVLSRQVNYILLCYEIYNFFAHKIKSAKPKSQICILGINFYCNMQKDIGTSSFAETNIEADARVVEAHFESKRFALGLYRLSMEQKRFTQASFMQQQSSPCRLRYS